MPIQVRAQSEHGQENRKEPSHYFCNDVSFILSGAGFSARENADQTYLGAKDLTGQRELDKAQ